MDKESFYRISIGFDFLIQSMRNGDSFKHHVPQKETETPCSIKQHIETLMLLCEGSRLLDRQSLIEIVKESLERIENNSFARNDELHLVDNDTFHSQNNALASLLYWQLDDNEKAIKYATATLNGITNINKGHGHILISLLTAYQKTQKTEFQNAVRNIASEIINGKTIDHHGLKALQISGNKLEEAKIQHILKTIRVFPPKGLTSEASAVMLLSCIYLQFVLKPTPPWLTVRINQLLHHQKNLQIFSDQDTRLPSLYKGAFIMNDLNQDYTITLEGMIYSLEALINYSKGNST